MVDQNTNPSPEPNLPPAGYKREEELARRTDILEEEIDNRSKDTLAVDPSKFEVDREIRYHLEKGELEVSNPDPEYVYKWVQSEHPYSNPSRMVDSLRYKSISVDGVKYPTWQVVTGDMQEAVELKTAIGTRKLGDTILMRCHKRTYEIIQNEERRKRLQRQYGLDERLVELAMSSGTRAGEQLFAEQGRQSSHRMDFDEMLRTGNVPGFETNQRR